MPRLNDRGQLMLVGAVVIAVSLLGLAVVLNSTIHTQNTNPGNTLEETREVEQQLQVIRTDISRLTDRLSQHNNQVDARELRTTLIFYSNRKAEQVVDQRPAYINISLNKSESDFDREVLRQNNPTRSIVSRTDESDWTLVTNAALDESTPFEAVIKPQDDGSQPTRIVVEGNDDRIWVLRVTQGPSNTVKVVVIYSNTTTATRTVPGHAAQLNITGGTVNGTQSFAFAPGLEAPYDVQVINGHHATGTYTVIADEASGIKNNNFYADTTDGQPYVSREVTTAVIDFEYVSDEVSAQSQITIQIKESPE